MSEINNKTEPAIKPTGKGRRWVRRTSLTTGVLLGVGIPTALIIVGMREHQRQIRRTIVENLVKLDGAKEQWALENNKKATDSVSWETLMTPPPGACFWHTIEQEFEGGTYILGTIGESPKYLKGNQTITLSNDGHVVTTTVE